MSAGANLRSTGVEVAEFLVLDQNLVCRLVALAHSRFGIDPADAEDLIQETALEIARSPSLISSPEGFAFQVFHNRCVRFLDRQVKRGRVFVPPDEYARQSAPDAKLDERVLVRTAFARISSTCRGLLTIYYIEGSSLKETAARSGHSSKQVWKRLNACLKKLKETIGA